MTYHERKLELETLEAADAAAETAHVEKDPFLIILWRLTPLRPLLRRPR